MARAREMITLLRDILTCPLPVIVAIDGQKVENEQDLAQTMNNHRAGDTVKISVYRWKKKMDVNVSLVEARQQV